MLKDCREFQKLHEGFTQMRRQAVNPGFGPALGGVAHGAPPPPGGPSQWCGWIPATDMVYDDLEGVPYQQGAEEDHPPSQPGRDLPIGQT